MPIEPSPQSISHSHIDHGQGGHCWLAAYEDEELLVGCTGDAAQRGREGSTFSCHLLPTLGQSVVQP